MELPHNRNIKEFLKCLFRDYKVEKLYTYLNSYVRKEICQANAPSTNYLVEGFVRYLDGQFKGLAGDTPPPPEDNFYILVVEDVNNSP
jgi:hypothetical protein